MSEALIFASTNPQYIWRQIVHWITSSIHENSKLKPGENMLCTEIASDIQNNFCTQHVLPMFCKKKSFWQRFTCRYYIKRPTLLSQPRPNLLSHQPPTALTPNFVEDVEQPLPSYEEYLAQRNDMPPKYEDLEEPPPAYQEIILWMAKKDRKFFVNQ